MMDEGKIIIQMQGGPVITGGTFTNVEFVANKYVHAEREHEGQGKYVEDAIEVAEAAPELPDILCTPEAEALFARLHAAGIVDAQWQPIDLSNAEKGTLAEYIAEKLKIRNKWKLFGNLWKMEPETLRTSKARGLEQEKTWEFRGQLNAL